MDWFLYDRDLPHDESHFIKVLDWNTGIESTLSRVNSWDIYDIFQNCYSL